MSSKILSVTKQSANHYLPGIKLPIISLPIYDYLMYSIVDTPAPRVLLEDVFITCPS
jgi:hypothetical protein